MTQYVIQVKNDTQQLIKSYEVSEKSPIRDIVSVHALDRKQVVIEDTGFFNEICEVYKEHKLNAKFTLDEEAIKDIDKVSWEIIN